MIDNSILFLSSTVIDRIRVGDSFQQVHPSMVSPLVRTKLVDLYIAKVKFTVAVSLQ